MRAKGTIIITDPCYVVPDDMEDHIFQDKLTNYIWEDTLYGDWGCTTLELKDECQNKYYSDLGVYDIKSELGNFCADSGQVGVFLLEEVLKFNPEFDKFIEDHDWCVTVIEDFDGEVEYCISEEDGDESAYIRGCGNINFVTMQTSL